MGGVLLLVLAGALLCNAIPHLASGLRGEAFPTPFAKPRGVGRSPPVTNILWGNANLFAGGAILISHQDRLGLATSWAGIAIGFLALGLYVARYFGKVRQDGGW
jgi:hypothetical protein